ncbi:MAG: UvrD-helicase domain-containing protein [Microbacteriaceae bacterium]|nr:UvrD-helicase domain-containing protein [Microbacteriaceae bacterium]
MELLSADRSTIDTVNAHSALLEGLNPQQKAAVEYRGDALLIVAGAGSGKTRVLTHRIAHLIETRDAWPSQILAITFTNKAAAEMRERVHQLLGETGEWMWISTFHSACVRILRKEAEHLGYLKSFSIYDSSDSRALIKRLLKDTGAEYHGLKPGGVQAMISKAKNELKDADAFARGIDSNNPYASYTAEVFRRYQEELRASNAFDFDDLVAETVYLLRDFPEVANRYRHRFRHILVDEYQDTNHAQYQLIRELTRPIDPMHLPEDLAIRRDLPTNPASLTVVGDSDQSIYAFRGADIRNIVEFERDFPGAQVILLEQNYRSTQNILDAANGVISHNFDRKDKNLWTSAGSGELVSAYVGYNGHDEAQFVADAIEQLRITGTPYREMAVFYRVNAQSRPIEEVFTRAAVPYRVIGGTRFYDRAEVKDAIAYLLSVANPLDSLSLRRILNTPKRGIGPATEAQLQVYAETQHLSLRQALAHVDELPLGPKVVAEIKVLTAILDDAEALAAEGKVSEVLQLIIDRTGVLRSYRATRDPQDEARAENVEELLAVTIEYEKQNPEGGLVGFLAEAALVAGVDDLDDESGTVSLMTMHTAKGLEFDAVFVTGLEEGLLPHRISLGEPGGVNEERRLLYVALTRAKKNLHISLSGSRAVYGDIEAAAPSRFLDEIPAELLNWKSRPPRKAAEDRSLLGTSSWQDDPPKQKIEWKNSISSVRDNGDLQLSPGDRINHDNYGQGRVMDVTGEGSKAKAVVDFSNFGRKTLLIKIAPITKL